MSTFSTLRGMPMGAVIGKCSAERLAPEVLSMIFLEVIALHEPDPIMVLPTSPDSELQENELTTKPLHTLTHICRYWRDVALGNPALWRRTHGRCHDQMRVFLERSQSLTVTLFLAVVHWNTPEDGPIPAPMESLVKTHAARLCRLDLSAVPARQNISVVLGSLQARHLEVLTIASPSMYHTSSALSGTTMTRELLLNGEIPPLKALAIMPIVDWMPSCTPFLHLTHLFISFDAEPGLGHPFHVLELLSNTPVLVFCHVDLLIFDVPFSGTWHPPSDGIALSQLRSLVFTTCSYNHIQAVLSRLLLPEDVFIRLQGTGGHTDVEADGHPAALPPFALRPVTSLDVSTEHEQFRVVADGPTSGLWLDGRYSASDGPDPAGWESWLLQLHKSISFSHVTHLHIHLRPQSIFLTELLGQLPQLSRLAVLLGESTGLDDDDADDDDAPQDIATVIFPMMVLCNTLSPGTPASASANSTGTATMPHVPCPVLRTLVIEWKQKVTPEVMKIFPRIPAMLAARARAGVPLRRVVLQAASHPLSPETGIVTALDVFRGFSHAFHTSETEYEVVEREEGAEGLCAFKMRDVWRVEGEEKYWEVAGYEKPGYGLRHKWR